MIGTAGVGHRPGVTQDAPRLHDTAPATPCTPTTPVVPPPHRQPRAYPGPLAAVGCWVRHLGHPEVETHEWQGGGLHPGVGVCVRARNR